MNKRLLTLVLAVVMILSFATVGASATATDIVIIGGTANGELTAGSTVSLPVSISGNPGLAYGQVTASWDNSALKLTGITYGIMPDCNSAPITDGMKTYTVAFGNWMATENNTENGVLFTMNFEVLSTAAAGDYTVTLSAAADAFLDKDVNSYSVVLTNGTISLNNNVAKIGHVSYEKIADALVAAKAGDVVEVFADSEEKNLVVKSGVTLDLGSHTVKARHLIALNGSTITGATMEDANSGAKLIVPQGSIAVTNGKAVPSENGWSIIPVYVDGAYTFARAMIHNPQFTKPAEGAAKIEFVPTFNKYVKQNIFNDGCEDNDVAIIIRVVYMEEDIQVTREYYYTTPMVKASMLNNQSMFAEMTGCNKLTDLEFSIAIIADCGVVLESQTYTY